MTFYIFEGGFIPCFNLLAANNCHYANWQTFWKCVHGRSPTRWIYKPKTGRRRLCTRLSTCRRDAAEVKGIDYDFNGQQAAEAASHISPKSIVGECARGVSLITARRHCCGGSSKSRLLRRPWGCVLWPSHQNIGHPSSTSLLEQQCAANEISKTIVRAYK